MTLDDLLSRHRPDDRLSADERAGMLATLVEEREHGPANENSVITLIGEHGRSRRRRRVWGPAAAAAVVVLACAGALAVWRTTDVSDTGEAAVGAASPVCPATLPASWAAARSTRPLQVDGHNAVPYVSTPNGDQVLSWDPTPTTVTFGRRDAGGHITSVATFPRGASEGPSVEATDGRHVVFASHPDPSSPPDDVLLVNTATRARVHLLPAAPMPAGWVVRTDVAMLNGYVYWGATPGETDDSHGIVIRYSINDGTYRVLARLDRFPQVVSDFRGVAWPTGAVYRTGLPPALNHLLDANGDPVDRLVTDGRAYGWQLINGNQSIFHWADSTGATRTFRVSIGAAHDGAELTAVSGPFLFFHVNQAKDSESVLDTRTGALAPSGGNELVLSYPGQHLFTMAGGFDYHEVTPSALHGFDCR